MKSNSLTLLCTALACAVAMSVTSCSDDDNLTPEQKAEKEAAEKAEKASKFWDVASQLVDNSAYTEDYQDKTFEPTIGVAEEGNTTERVVLTNSPAAAAQFYSYLVGAEGIDENTATHTFRDPDVGTLTYTKTGGNSWATVDVDIKQIPHLTRIIYRSAEQGGDNASFGGGTAYYRFGDVISRQITTFSGAQATEYWICVRPSFDPEGKGESHWVTISPLPKENVWEYPGTKSSNKRTYRMPTKLGTSKEHMQNFAEMLFAIHNASEWSDNITNHSDEGFFGPSGLPIFHDFHKSKIKYNNQYFWEEVRDAWFAKNIYLNVFGLTNDGMRLIVNNGDFKFLYSGYKWNTYTSNGPTLYIAEYKNGEGKKANLHNVTYSTYQNDVIYKKNPEQDMNFDITTLMTANKPYVRYDKFFGEDFKGAYFYVVRTATGEELGGGRYDPQQPIPGFSEVYRYNTVYGVENLLDEPGVSGGTGTVVNDIQKQNVNDDYTGIPYYRVGDAYKDQDGNRWLCVWNSGLNVLDKSPYSYFISFDGIKIANAGTRYEDMGSLDTKIRTTFGFLLMAYQSYLPGPNWKIFRTPSSEVFLYPWDRFLPVFWLPQVGDEKSDPRQNIMPLCVPYDGPSTVGQNLLRMQINTIDFERNNIYASIWTHYPTEQLRDTQPSNFSNLDILLQDIASSDMVNRFADDRVARMAIEYPKSQETIIPRPIRTTADERAMDLSKYITTPVAYQYFNEDTPKSMWNDPILVFRATRIYDRGHFNHATKAENGATLTALKKIYCYDDSEEADMFVYFGDNFFKGTFTDLMDASYLDGKKYTVNWRKK